MVPPQAPPAPVPEPQVPPSPDLLKTPLAESLARQIPAAPPSFRAARVDAFNKSRTNKAMAVAAPDSVWTTAGLPSAAAAEASALEKCQVYFRRTCSVVAINDTIVPNPVMRDMPRVRWRGHLDPDQVPGLLPETRPTASDWQNYLNNTGFKAIAYHPWGKVVMKTSTTSQKQAEEQALTECNADPQRNGRDGPCYLYAIRNSVVLTSYFIEPHRPVTTLDDLLSLLQVPTDYKSEKNNKAIAYAFNRRGSYRVSNRPDQDIAAEAALEGCQLMYKEPCVLIAQNDRVLADGDPFQGTPRRTVSLDYSGKFSRDQIPKLFRAKLTEIASYEAMKGPRAMAVRPVNSLLTVSGGATQKEAEQQALDSCNKDMSPYPYFLYAAQDQVVIARRLTEPR